MTFNYVMGYNVYWGS